MNSTQYRPDIDGLRALAVLSVLFFHLDIDLFRGGFVGVDIFFVISGFLITRLIFDEVVQTNTFNWMNFYERRARRLLPSLFFTLFVSFIMAFLLFAPQDFKRFSGALFFSLFSFSNFYFWSESGYFDAASDIKPLLHTWSLGVEEQFYYVWPIFLVYLLLRVSPFATTMFIILVGLVSFVLNLIMVNIGNLDEASATIFFLTPFRVFEFSIGGILVLLVNSKKPNNIFLEILLIVGLGMTLYSVFFFTENMFFPSYNALLPCLGTALIIYAGSARYMGKLLNNSIAIRVGLISYSLYLIHWPIIVFYKYYKSESLDSNEQVLIFSLTLVLAFLMYHFIETPFRLKGKTKALFTRKSYFVVCIVFITAIAIPSASAWYNNGWLFRVDLSGDLKDFVRYGGGEGDFHKTNYGGLNSQEYPELIGVATEPKMLLVGDSHARQYVEGFIEFTEKTNKSLAVLGQDSSCFFRIKRCDEFDKKFFNVFEETQVRTLIIGQRWDFTKYLEIHFGNSELKMSPKELANFYTDRIANIIERLQNTNLDKLILLGALPQVPNHGNLVTCVSRPSYITGPELECDESEIELHRELQFRKLFNFHFEKLLTTKLQTNINVRFFNPFDILCDNGVCMQIESGNLIYSDDDHLSLYGSKKVFKYLEDLVEK